MSLADKGTIRFGLNYNPYVRHYRRTYCVSTVATLTQKAVTEAAMEVWIYTNFMQFPKSLDGRGILKKFSTNFLTFEKKSLITKIHCKKHVTTM